MPKPTRGSEALAAHIAERDGPARELAAELAVGADLVSRWSRGLAPPSGPNRTKLEKALRIPSIWWDEEPAGSPKEPAA